MSTELRAAPRPRTHDTAKMIWLVAGREITTKLRSKAFIISTSVLLIFVLGGVVISGMFSQGKLFAPSHKVAVVSGVTHSLGEEFEIVQLEDRAFAVRAVLNGAVDAAIVPGGDTSVDLTVIALDGVPLSLVQALSATPTVELLRPTTDNPLLAYVIAFAFGVVFMMSALTFGGSIAQSVVEEKQTRIVEMLLATVSARTILGGKILGNSLLALGQVVAIAVLSAIGMLATGQELLLTELGSALVWFGVLFAFAFVMLAAIYAALAALVSRQEEVAVVTGPVMWLVMLPYIAILFFNDNAQIVNVMSYIPFSAPVGMPVRLFLGTAQWWEPVVSLLILLVSITIVWRLGSRIYAATILRTGRRVKVQEALRSEG